MRHRLRHLLRLALCLPAAVCAHEVRVELHQAPATVVTLRYADGEPFSHERYEVLAEGAKTPLQTGYTDARGRVAIPLDERALDLRATSADGHGTTLRIAPGAVSPAPTFAATTACGAGLPRWLLALAGGGVIFGLFGLVQMFLRHR